MFLKTKTEMLRDIESLKADLSKKPMSEATFQFTVLSLCQWIINATDDPRVSKAAK